MHFSTELLYDGESAFSDGDILDLGGVVQTNFDLVECFEPTADFVGLDALYLNVKLDSGTSYEPPENIQPLASAVGIDLVGPEALKDCAELAFSTEEDFVTSGPLPPDGNPIISDGDLLGPDCAVCARNGDLLEWFGVAPDLDLGLDAADVLDVDKYVVAFSTELDSPHIGQFTAGDLLITNVTIIPNVALLFATKVAQDMGLDSIHFWGKPSDIASFLGEAAKLILDAWF